jgi:hypothetical protein
MYTTLKHICSLALLATLLAVATPALAQCDEKADSCSAELFPFNSDGNYFRAQLFPGESAKLRITMYEGMVYRVIPCSGSKTGERLVFDLYDKKGNLLYSNLTAKPTETHWDFSFGATSEYTMVARYKKGGGCASIIVGYQEDDQDDLNIE